MASYLPNDGFVMTDGSNNGLDSYDWGNPFDGERLVEEATLPPSANVSGLPEGFFGGEPDPDDVPSTVARSEDEGFDLTAMLREGVHWEPNNAITGPVPSLVDLDWLDPTLGNDTKVLPVNPVDKGIEELARAWDFGQGTNGLRLEPNNKDKEVLDYRRSISEGPRSGLPGDSASKAARQLVIASVLRRAQRRSAYGDSLKEILVEASEALGNDAKSVRAAFAQISAEHGLAGKVFIHASAFPGITSGKWNEAIRRRCANARYIVAEAGHPLLQSDGFLGKSVVSDVPWMDAWRRQARLSAQTGIKVAATPKTAQEAKTALLALFGQAAPKASLPLTHQPIDVRPADRVTAEVAKAALAASKAPVAQVMDRADMDAEALRKRARTQIGKWQESGLLPVKDAGRILLSGAPAKALLTAALQIIQATGKTATYGGAGANFPKVAVATREEAFAGLAAAEGSIKKVQAEVDGANRSRLATKFGAMVSAGLLEKREADIILGADRTPEQALHLAFVCVSRRASAKVAIPTVNGRTAKYQGAGKGAIPTNQLSLGQAKTALQNAPDPNQGIPAVRAAHDRQMAIEHVEAFRNAGLITDKQSDKLKAAHTDLNETLAAVAAMVVRHQLAPMPIPVQADVQVPVYAGEGKKAYPIAQADSASAWEDLRTASDDFRVPDIEVRACIKWARRQLSEGMLGHDLDEMLRVRFSSPLLKTAASRLAALRSAHEGLSGVLYVDAAAYASKDGATGCDQGGLKHRSSYVKNVLAMARCADCTFANAGPDGKRTCQKYNKALVASPPVDDPQAFQANTLRKANQSDAEQTASLFAGGHEVDDYKLRNAEMEDLILDDLAPRAEDLGEILYGGLETIW